MLFRSRTLEALAYGRSDLREGMKVGGLVGHHLAITKALFDHTRRGVEAPQLDSPIVRALADDLRRAGWEIVPHSATPSPDDRSVTESALADFEHFGARTWIDHQPDTNCEAFGDQGFHSTGRYGIADLLAGHHYQYVWAEIDAPPEPLNLLRPDLPEARHPTLWPLGRLDSSGPSELWMFRTSWAFLSARDFYELYRPSALDRLEDERGVHIAHTYLESYHARDSHFGRRNLLVPAARGGRPGGAGPVSLHPRFESLLAELEMRQARGTLWVPTLADLGDQLRSVAEVTIRMDRAGQLVVHAPRPMRGLSFVVPRPELQIEVAGLPPKDLRHEAGQTLFCADFEAGDTVVRLTGSEEDAR